MADRVQFLHCSIRNTTMGAYGSVVYLQNAHIEFSTFDSNFVDESSSLVSMSGNAGIEFSTFDSNFVDEYGSLVSMSGNTRVDPFRCLVSMSDSIALTACNTFSNNIIERYGSLINANPSLLITNSTFTHNNISRYGRFFECATNCSVISSVIEDNVVSQYGIFLRSSQVLLLASNLAHNDIYRFFGAGQLTIDCTSFANNSMPSLQQQLVSNSTACNQLLLTGNRGVCQRDSCRGKNMCLAEMYVQYVLCAKKLI